MKSRLSRPTQTNPNPYEQYETFFGSGMKVITDKKSRTRNVHFPFEFPDESPGVVIICKVKDEDWIPSQDIDSVIINFKK